MKAAHFDSRDMFPLHAVRAGQEVPAIDAEIEPAAPGRDQCVGDVVTKVERAVHARGGITPAYRAAHRRYQIVGADLRRARRIPRSVERELLEPAASSTDVPTTRAVRLAARCVCDSHIPPRRSWIAAAVDARSCACFRATRFACCVRFCGSAPTPPRRVIDEVGKIGATTGVQTRGLRRRRSTCGLRDIAFAWRRHRAPRA